MRGGEDRMGGVRVAGGHRSGRGRYARHGPAGGPGPAPVSEILPRDVPFGPGRVEGPGAAGPRDPAEAVAHPMAGVPPWADRNRRHLRKTRSGNHWFRRLGAGSLPGAARCAASSSASGGLQEGVRAGGACGAGDGVGGLPESAGGWTKASANAGSRRAAGYDRMRREGIGTLRDRAHRSAGGGVLRRRASRRKPQSGRKGCWAGLPAAGPERRNPSRSGGGGTDTLRTSVQGRPRSD